jgi:hypothetical protein
MFTHDDNHIRKATLASLTMIFTIGKVILAQNQGVPLALAEKLFSEVSTLKV